ncbi:hypothetical protein KI387_033683, partial [Taxus chinensis]
DGGDEICLGDKFDSGLGIVGKYRGNYVGLDWDYEDDEDEEKDGMWEIIILG